MQEGFKVWWQRIFEEADKRGAEVITVTPEFGPPLYVVAIRAYRPQMSDMAAWLQVCLDGPFHGQASGLYVGCEPLRGTSGPGAVHQALWCCLLWQAGA